MFICVAVGVRMTQVTVGTRRQSGLCARFKPLSALQRRKSAAPILIKQLLDSVNSIFNSPLPAELSSERPDVRAFALISETPR